MFPRKLSTYIGGALALILGVSLAKCTERRDFIRECVGPLSAKDDASATKSKTERCVAHWEAREK
jgi:hypothetical protein